jgi:transcriptional regulator with XRE-family HTH domain
MQDFLRNSKNVVYNLRMPGGRPTTKPASALGSRIAEARTIAGLSQTDLASKMGVEQYQVAYWERKSVSLKAEILVKLANALNVSTDFILGRETSTKRGKGPVGKAQRVFEQVSQLPRGQQQHIVRVVEDLLKAQAS